MGTRLYFGKGGISQSGGILHQLQLLCIKRDAMHLGKSELQHPKAKIYH